MDLAPMTTIRPAEIKTYHKSSYDRISPEKTFNGQGKTVLITGGASGIGLASAESFARAGVQHLVLVQRRQEALDEAKKSLGSKFPNVKITTYAASVTDYEKITSLLKEVGQIDVLVSNAGWSHPFGPSKDVKLADFQATFEINVFATFHIIKEFLALASTGPRTIIVTSSAVSQLVNPGQIGYGPSKASSNIVVQHFANETANEDVTVQTFHPGAIYTPGVKGLVPEDFFAWEDVELAGDFAVWLASDEAKFLAGKFVWAQWDVDELLTLKERMAANPLLLTTTIML